MKKRTLVVSDDFGDLLEVKENIEGFSFTPLVPSIIKCGPVGATQDYRVEIMRDNGYGNKTIDVEHESISLTVKSSDFEI